MTTELKTQLSTQQQKTLLSKIHLIMDDFKRHHHRGPRSNAGG